MHPDTNGRPGTYPFHGCHEQVAQRARAALATSSALLGREEVPSLTGVRRCPTRLVMLWELLGREEGVEAGEEAALL